jgi:hypothetical protein
MDYEFFKTVNAITISFLQLPHFFFCVLKLTRIFERLIDKKNKKILSANFLSSKKVISDDNFSTLNPKKWHYQKIQSTKEDWRSSNAKGLQINHLMIISVYLLTPLCFRLSFSLLSSPSLIEFKGMGNSSVSLSLVRFCWFLFHILFNPFEISLVTDLPIKSSFN